MSRKNWQIALLGLTGLLTAALPTYAQTEHRDFDVHVDGKPAGQSVVTIAREADGRMVVTAQVEVKVKHLLGVYTFTYTGTEIWKDGLLASLRSAANDNGKKLEVMALSEPRGLRVIANGKEQMARLDCWTNSCWKLPDARFFNQAVPMLDVDSGKESTGQLKYVGAEQIMVGGQPLACHRFTVTGRPTTLELWFDSQHRLVRQEFTEDGHKTVVQLTAIR